MTRLGSFAVVLVGLFGFGAAPVALAAYPVHDGPGHTVEVHEHTISVHAHTATVRSHR